MSTNWLVLQRTPILQSGQLEHIEETMVRVLQEVGIRVLNVGLRANLESRGFRVWQDRVFIEGTLTRRFLDNERQRNGNLGGPCVPPDEKRLSVYVSPYPQHVHDLATDRVVPFTTERLIEATKLVDVLSDRGVTSSPPGCPIDPPPLLQPVIQYWIAATYSRQGLRPPDPKAEATFPYVAEMAEVLGHPIRYLPVYVFSPLTLGGESLKCVLRFHERLSGVVVSSMPAPGSTAPIDLGPAFAQAAAEAVGPAILLREALELPISWRVSLYAVDLRSMAMIFGSPENVLFHLAARELTAYLAGTQWIPWPDNMHTNAKVPGAQACAEKSSLMTMGALLGGRNFGAAGTLSLDELFSAEQLVYDLEIKDHVERLLNGLEVDADSSVEAVAEGVSAGTFAGLQRTVERYRSVYWHPLLFDREFLSAWQAKGARTMGEKARALVAEYLSQHEYRLASALQRELDRIVDHARKALA